MSSLDYVNQRTISGKSYTAWRDSETPFMQYVECDGKRVQCSLRDVWNDDEKLISLFNGSTTE